MEKIMRIEKPVEFVTLTERRRILKVLCAMQVALDDFEHIEDQDLYLQKIKYHGNQFAKALSERTKYVLDKAEDKKMLNEMLNGHSQLTDLVDKVVSYALADRLEIKEI